MLENLLFYTVLLQDVLPRLFRVDLAMPKNAYMLFRLSKVLNLPRLSDMVRDGKSQIIAARVRITTGGYVSTCFFVC